jgi:hypothetical protein
MVPNQSFANNKDLVKSLLTYPAPIPSWSEEKNYASEQTESIDREKQSFCAIDAPIDSFLYCWSSEFSRFSHNRPEIDDEIKQRITENFEQNISAVSGLLALERVLVNDGSLEKVVTLYKLCIAGGCELGKKEPDWLNLVRYWLLTHHKSFEKDLTSVIDSKNAFSFTKRLALYKKANALADAQLPKLLEDWKQNRREFFLMMHQVFMYESTHDTVNRNRLINFSLSPWLSNLYLEYNVSEPTKLNSTEGYEFVSEYELKYDSLYDYTIKSLLLSDWQGKLDFFKELVLLPHLSSDDVYSYSQFNPDILVPALIDCLKTTDEVTKDKIVAALASYAGQDTREDILRALLPWLSNPAWSNAPELKRLRVIQGLDSFSIPESVPGLLWVVENDPEASNVRYALETLVFYKPTNIKDIVQNSIQSMSDQSYREQSIRLALRLNIFSSEQILQSIRKYIEFVSTEEGQTQWNERTYSDEPLINWEYVLGYHGQQTQAPEIQNRIIASLLSSKTVSNEELLNIVFWQNEKLDNFIVKRLAAGSANADLVYSLLKKRRSFSAGTRSELKSYVKQSSYVAGIAAVLLNDPKLLQDIISQGENESLTSMLALARLVRAPIDLKNVNQLQFSDDPFLAKAAKLYLEAEDSASARKFRQSAESDEILILGARSSFDPGHVSFGDLDNWEHRLQTIQTSQDADQVIALLSAGFWGNRGQIVVTVYQDTAKITLYEDNGRFRFRELSKIELTEMLNFIHTNNIDGLGPHTPDIHDGMQYEYVHITPEFGRRVFINNPGHNNDIYTKLTKVFFELKKAGNYKLDYAVRETERSLTIMDKQDIPNEWTEHKRQAKSFVNVCDSEFSSWQTLSPKGHLVYKNNDFFYCKDNSLVKAVDIETRKYGRYPLITPDGNWLIAAKTDTHWGVPNYLVKLDLQSGVEQRLNFDEADNLDPLIWLKSQQKALIVRSKDAHSYNKSKSKGPIKAEYYLYDPNSDQQERVEGDFYGISAVYENKLVPTGEPNTVWMSRGQQFEGIKCVIGKYNYDTFTFTPIKTIDEFYVDSKNIWVDPTETYVYAEMEHEVLRFKLH